MIDGLPSRLDSGRGRTAAGERAADTVLLFRVMTEYGLRMHRRSETRRLHDAAGA